MKLSLTLPLPLHLYQEGRERVVETGHACPECNRRFDNTTWLRSHRESVHGFFDEVRIKELERLREKKRLYEQRRIRKRTKG